LFYANSVGRVIVWINGEKILDHTGDGITPGKSEGAVLNAGQRYLIRVKYFGPPSANEVAMIDIAWASTDVRKQTIVGGSFTGPDQDNLNVPLVDGTTQTPDLAVLLATEQGQSVESKIKD
jgi:hypothetical protein